MKKYLFTILLTLCATINIHATSIELDGIKYDILSTSDLTLSVSGFISGYERRSVKIPGHIEYLGKTFSVVEIGERAFDDNKIIEHIEFPNTIKSIRSGAFRNTRIKEAILPEGLEFLDLIVFKECSSLEKVILPSSVTEVWCSAFNDCGNIDTVIIEDSNKSFSKPHYANSPLFRGCDIENMYLGRTIEGSDTNEKRPTVKNLTIGPKVTSIVNMFDFSNLKRIKLMTSVPPAINIASDICHMTVKVYVPKGSLQKYKSHYEWGEYWNIEEYDESCAAPEISFEDGILKITAVTQGAICHYTINDKDIVTDAEITGSVQLTGTYEIEAYAVLNDSKSEHSYATISWIDNTFNTNGILQPLTEAKRPIIIKSSNGHIIVEGLKNNETVDLYSMDGMHIGSASAFGNHAIFNQMIDSGQTLILRAGQNSIKFMVK